jgi:hypothetical protein
MDAGAEDANRRDVRGATILELHVDDEPAFVTPARLTAYTPAARQVAVCYRRPVRWIWLTTLPMLVVCALWFTVELEPLDSSQQRVDIGDIERTVRSALTGQLLGDLRVNSVRCVRPNPRDAHCVAELFDKSGDGPIIQGVTVSIEQETGEYFWQTGPAY